MRSKKEETVLYDYYKFQKSFSEQQPLLITVEDIYHTIAEKGFLRKYTATCTSRELSQRKQWPHGKLSKPNIFLGRIPAKTVKET